jgi:hypothetical protein
MLIVWDRLFGTFEPEQEPVTCGTVKPVDTFNPLLAALAPSEWTPRFRKSQPLAPRGASRCSSRCCSSSARPRCPIEAVRLVAATLLLVTAL